MQRLFDIQLRFVVLNDIFFTYLAEPLSPEDLSLFEVCQKMM